MAGGDPDFDKFNLKEHILSKYSSDEELEEKAKSRQNWQAQADLAMAYGEGLPELNIEKNSDAAIVWYEKSIENGNNLPWNVQILGYLHDLKETVPHQRRAHELYIKAARLGSVRAELNLAESYRCGIEGVIQEDMEEAFKWYRRAAGEEPRNDDTEDSNISSGYSRGTWRKYDIDPKLTALKKLHEYYVCGDCSEGEPQPVKALYYLKRAAEIGDPEAQKDLGLVYLTGESGYSKDLDKAKRWLGKAAKNGDEQAKQILKKLDDQNVADTTQPETGHPDFPQNFVEQYKDIMKMQMKREELHPYNIQNPTIFQESTFTQFQDSPTAQRYLKAFRLVKKGLRKLQESKFPDNAEGIKLMAQGILYENSITQSFPDLHKISELNSLFCLIDEDFKDDPNFFEGLLLLVMLYPAELKRTFKRSKLDLKRIMSLNKLIKKAEPDKPPKEDPYNFEEDYSSWLHELYYSLGSHYAITICYGQGAEAFQQSLDCCPSYYEAKVGLAYCLTNMTTRKFVKYQQLSADEELLESFEPPKNQRMPKGDYLTWTDHQLRQKAKQLFLEYLEEAPECAKKYPNCHYHLAYLYDVEKDLQEAIKWKEKGEDAEEKRLPFMEPVDVGSKKMLGKFDMLPVPKVIEKKCSNVKCTHKGTAKLTLKPCPCHKASYCGSECQKADWKEHKKTCSRKKKISPQ